MKCDGPKQLATLCFLGFWPKWVPRGQKMGILGQNEVCKKVFFFSKTYPQNFIILHHKTPFGSIIIMRRKKWNHAPSKKFQYGHLDLATCPLGETVVPAQKRSEWSGIKLNYFIYCHYRPFGPFWAILGQFGPFWAILGHFEEFGPF